MFFPNYSSVLPKIKFSTEKDEIVTAEGDKLLAKGAIKKVVLVDGQFISNLFLVPKKDEILRRYKFEKNEFICWIPTF